MPAVFVDASAWISALVPRESRHTETRAFYAGAGERGFRFITTPFVVAETHALVLRFGGPERGRRFLETAFDIAAHTVVPITGELIAAAVDNWIRKHRDQPFSLCDAVSFEVMQRERLTSAFTLDHHFRIAGFETVPA